MVIVRSLRLAFLLAALAPAGLAHDIPATITGDLDGDGVPDRVEVKANAGDPELFDVMVDLTAAKRTVLALELGAGELVEAPSIAQGELHLSFGWYQHRYKSSTDFTIGMRDGQLVVRRYRIAVADSISRAPDGGVLVKVCDADFVANQVTLDDKPANPPPGPPVAVAAWRTPQSVPKVCAGMF
jgi:hypothetical protein